VTETITAGLCGVALSLVNSARRETPADLAFVASVCCGIIAAGFRLAVLLSVGL
jgi:hypothetical protein